MVYGLLFSCIFFGLIDEKCVCFRTINRRCCDLAGVAATQKVLSISVLHRKRCCTYSYISSHVEHTFRPTLAYDISILFFCFPVGDTRHADCRGVGDKAAGSGRGVVTGVMHISVMTNVPQRAM